MRSRVHVMLVCSSFALVAFSWHRAARACSCLPPPPALEAADKSAMVFEGRAGPPTRDGARTSYHFTVERVFKGSEVAEVEIFTASHGASCGRAFDPDRKYLVYAYDYGGGRLGDGLCSRTRPSATARADLAKLGPGTASSSEPPESGAASEPPRIAPNGPPPAASSPSASRGCQVGALPHAPSTLFGLLAGLLGIAAIRRSPLG